MPAILKQTIEDFRPGGADYCGLSLDSKKVKIVIKIDPSMVQIVDEYKWIYNKTTKYCYGTHKVTEERIALHYLIAKYAKPGCVCDMVRPAAPDDMRVAGMWFRVAYEIPELPEPVRDFKKPDVNPDDDTECDPPENED